MKRVILFDLGKVLIDFDFSIALERLKKYTCCNAQEIMDFFRNSKVAQGWDKGTIREEEFYQAAKQTLGFSIAMEPFRQIWNEIFTVKREMVDFALSLKNRFQIGILTNTNPWHIHYIREQYSWMRELRTQIASCEVGLLKPDPEIYRLAMRRLNAVPEEIVYVDDSEENVLSAQKIGIDSFLFRDMDRLKEELKGALGIAPALLEKDCHDSLASPLSGKKAGLTENDLSDIRNEG